MMNVEGFQAHGLQPVGLEAFIIHHSSFIIPSQSAASAGEGEEGFDDQP